MGEVDGAGRAREADAVRGRVREALGALFERFTRGREGGEEAGAAIGQAPQSQAAASADGGAG